MAEPVLYASVLSPYGNRVRLAAALKGIPLPVEPPPGGRTGTPELRALHPWGRVPVMKVGDTVLVESLALLDYLEDAYPHSPSLRPQEATQAARARMIALLFDHNVFGAFRGVFAELLKPGAADSAAVAGAFDKVCEELQNLVVFFDAEGPAVGGRLSTADCAMVPFSVLMDALSAHFGVPSPTARVPRYQAWWAQLQQQPAVVEVQARMREALAGLITTLGK